MITLLMQCTFPSKVTYLDGVPIPFATDCPLTSRGALSVAGIKKDKAQFIMVTKNLTTVASGASNYFSFDLYHTALTSPSLLGLSNIEQLYAFANLTIGVTTRVVGVEFLRSCEYGAQIMNVSLNNLPETDGVKKVYYIFPKDYDCYNFNFSLTSFDVYIRRYQTSVDEKIAREMVRNNVFLTEFNTSVGSEPNIFPITNMSISVDYNGQSFNKSLDMSRSQEEIDILRGKAVTTELPHKREYYNCLYYKTNAPSPAEAAINAFTKGNTILTYNSTHTVITFKDYADCYLNAIPFYKTTPVALFTLVQNRYFYPYYVVGHTALSDDVYARNPSVPEPSSAGIGSIVSKLDQLDVVPLGADKQCNFSASMFYAEKPDFGARLSVYRHQTVENTQCVNVRGIAFALPEPVVQSSIQLNNNDFFAFPAVYNHVSARGEPISFQFDDRWLHCEAVDYLYLVLEMPQKVTFITPKRANSCFYLADYVYRSGSALMVVNKYPCDSADFTGAEGTLVKNTPTGLAFSSRYTCALPGAAEFDIYLCSTYTGIFTDTVSLDLSPHYALTRSLGEAQDFQPFEYMTEEEKSEQLAKALEYESSIYDAREWIRRNWWIFFIMTVLILATFVYSLYGCGLPCKWLLVSSADREAAQRQARMRKGKLML